MADKLDREMLEMLAAGQTNKAIDDGKLCSILAGR